MRRKRTPRKVENVIASARKAYQSDRKVFIKRFTSTSIFNPPPPEMGDRMRRELLTASASRTFSFQYPLDFHGQSFDKVMELAALHLAKMADENGFLPGRNLTAWMWPITDWTYHFTLIPARRRKK